MASSYCPGRQPDKYLGHGEVSQPSSGWNRSGAITLKTPGRVEPSRLQKLGKKW
uniref:Similarity n=1 Tax=Microcystis aeruginosa (strain PCC 7806) TaxID=267872 RepID=A8YBX8_MICA7|nr:unnamed protein product [Microcystis aeruginosa PCC 7806]